MSHAPLEGGPGLTFNADADAWRDVTSRYTGTWSDAMAATDLRWWRLEGRQPGRAFLAQRWGWSEHHVRAFLAWDRSHG